MIIFDEKKYAEEVIKKGFKTKNKIVYELGLLTRYYKTMHKNDEDIKNELIKVCEKHIQHFSMEEWYKIINKTMYLQKKNKLITGKVVELSKSEMDVIVSIENKKEQIVLFVLLVLYKFYDCKRFEVIIEDIFRLSKLNVNSKTKLSILQSLTSKGHIDITMGGKRWVTFAEKKCDSVITIKDFDDFIFEFNRYIGEDGYGGCQDCDKAIKINKYKKYCNDCAKNREKRRRREWKKQAKNE